MKTFRIIEITVDDSKAVHYIDCNHCSKISPFTVIADSVVITFMGEVISIELYRDNVDKSLIK